ncbi:uncharacterized protein LOC120128362 [Hibiscus syriacus]|uniref:uncharacterized protein LOC120128362 n=1 Tax=Hibiscus syriacus TaxID=106335 RepID=UPI001920EFF0|nr:uncharacterized protein LOC120128362 [Hibiscus syriacus]
MIKGYGRKSISPRCALKIDLHKAFNSIHWRFIIQILKALNLPLAFIAWIEACFTQVRFSISFNGTLIGYFKGARGVRQGDPLSLYLFILAMNILSRMLNLAAEREMFGFHPKYRKIGLTHLSFADDLLIFCKGNIDSVVGVLTILDRFYEVFRLKLNPAKCEIFAAGIPSRTVENLRIITGFQIRSLPIRYLGIPLVTRKLIEKDCQALIDNKSAAGARVSWDNICVSKSEGGLGLKNIKTWNKACLITLIRKILAGNGSLWVAWLKAYVFKEQDFWHYKAVANLSWSTNRILKLKAEAFPILSAGSPQVKEIWGLIRSKGQIVTWHKLIWFPMHIPQISLIAWMALFNKLPTRDRLLKMGISTDNVCVNCSNSYESRDRIFSQCTMAVEL